MGSRGICGPFGSVGVLWGGLCSVRDIHVDMDLGASIYDAAVCWWEHYPHQSVRSTLSRWFDNSCLSFTRVDEGNHLIQVLQRC